jgi:DNA-binding response OmpR family regulator
MRILVVEDDPKVQGLLAKGLREESYAIDTASDGEEALYQLSINDYDAVILDVMIPRPDGFEVLRELRGQGIRVPVLMLTARDAVEDRIQGLDLGADDYVVKPFAFDEIVARLRALLRRGESLRSKTLTVEDLVIDTHSRSAARAGRSISLTTKEYALLEFLARNQGRVVGREEIAEHVWDETFDPLSNLIEVYVNRLRKKVDVPGTLPLLHTRRGAGYVLAASGG